MGRREGFTLIEVIAVLAIFAVVSSLGGVMFFKMTSAWAEVHGRSELDMRIEQIFEQVRRDVNEMLSQELSGVSLRGGMHDTQREDDPDRLLAHDEVIFPVQTIGRFEEGDQAGLVMYSVKAEDGAGRLVRTTGALATEQPTDSTLSVAEHVLGFMVEYAPHTGGAWVRGWDRPYLPAAMRVSVTMAHPVRRYQQTARRAVFPIHVH